MLALPAAVIVTARPWGGRHRRWLVAGVICLLSAAVAFEAWRTVSWGGEDLLSVLWVMVGVKDANWEGMRVRVPAPYILDLRTTRLVVREGEGRRAPVLQPWLPQGFPWLTFGRVAGAMPSWERWDPCRHHGTGGCEKFRLTSGSVALECWGNPDSVSGPGIRSIGCRLPTVPIAVSGVCVKGNCELLQRVILDAFASYRPGSTASPPH
jgi:hypothetical protein